MGRTKAGQGGAIGANEEDRLDQITARLFDGERGEVGIIERAFGHDTIDGEAELFADLRHAEVGHARIAAPLFGEPGMGVVDGAFAAFDCNIHLMGLHAG